MERIIRTDGWTADWRLSSALWESYGGASDHAPSEGKAWVTRRPLAILCAGLPEDPIGQHVVQVADELSTYYPVVDGGTTVPLSPSELEGKVDSYRRPEAGRLARMSLLRPARGDVPGNSPRPVPDDDDAAPIFVAVVLGQRAPREDAFRLFVKSWAVSEEDDEEDPAAADPSVTGFSVTGDVEINVLLPEEEPQEDAAAEVAVDRVIDGFLRFFFKIGHDHTRFRRGR